MYSFYLVQKYKNNLIKQTFPSIFLRKIMWLFRFLYNTYACRKASIRNVREKFPSVRTVSYDTGGRKRKFAHMSNESITDYRLQFYNERIQNTEYSFLSSKHMTQNSETQFIYGHLMVLSMSDVRCQFYRTSIFINRHKS